VIGHNFSSNNYIIIIHFQALVVDSEGFGLVIVEKWNVEGKQL